jgi:hypothetical protein
MAWKPRITAKCHLCDQESETIDHIIASCSFSRQVWWNILTVLGANATQDWRRVNPSLVGCMETAMDWLKKKGSGLPLRTSGVRTVERAEREMLPRHRLHYTLGAFDHQACRQSMD